MIINSNLSGDKWLNTELKHLYQLNACQNFISFPFLPFHLYYIYLKNKPLNIIQDYTKDNLSLEYFRLVYIFVLQHSS